MSYLHGRHGNKLEVLGEDKFLMKEGIIFVACITVILEFQQHQYAKEILLKFLKLLLPVTV